ncbi:hypothetical protein KP509_32G002000 [Ceratopteris richardii]|nr:hypothetical protein KP509_32G002000 [Ceratopteris richardii]
MIEAVSRIEGIVLNIERHRAIVGEGTIADFPVVLAKPQTYANLIGESVVPLMEHYNVPVGKIVVMVEDMNVRIAKLQLVLKGGHGDHKGLINLIAHLQGNRNFPRLRMGIGLPPEKMDPKAFVLQRFCEQERKMIDKSILQGVDIVRVIATHGVHAAIDSMNKTKAAA